MPNKATAVAPLYLRKITIRSLCHGHVCEGECEGGRTLHGTRTPSSVCTWRLGPWRILAEYIRRKMEWMDASSRVVGSGTSLFGLGGAEGKSPRDIHAKGGVSAQAGSRRRDEQGGTGDRPVVYFFEFGVYF